MTRLDKHAAVHRQLGGVEQTLEVGVRLERLHRQEGVLAVPGDHWNDQMVQRGSPEIRDGRDLHRRPEADEVELAHLAL